MTHFFNYHFLPGRKCINQLKEKNTQNLNLVITWKWKIYMWWKRKKVNLMWKAKITWKWNLGIEKEELFAIMGWMRTVIADSAGQEDELAKGVFLFPDRIKFLFFSVCSISKTLTIINYRLSLINIILIFFVRWYIKKIL